MMSFEKRITLIIPIYNQETLLEQFLMKLSKMVKDCPAEILLVDDGSKDNSLEICANICRANFKFKVFHQENKGVSAARNLGIKNATGKYIFFLDADDELTPGTITSVADFFDSVYDDVDLVTYPIETVCQEKVLKPHFRYKYLVKSGIYDLRECPYIGQTTMNIVVKNKFDDNVLFDESQTFSEDQRYCCDVLHDKLKMGFCREGKYIYYRSSNSSSGNLSGSCYIFEQCTKFFEELFSKYEEVPLAFQGLYVNDLYWKMISNILFPYHYDSDEYARAIERLSEMLRRCDWRIIHEHPQMDFFEKFFLLRWMGKETLRCHVDNNAFSLVKDDRTVLSQNSMEMVITKVHVQGAMVEIYGFLKTVFFQFYDVEPTLCAIENNGKLTRKLHLYESSHSYYLSHEKTQKFYAMRYCCNIREVQNMHFEVEVGGCWFPVHYYFMPSIPFSHKHKYYMFVKEQAKICVLKDNSWTFEYLETKRKQRIWLYYDCKGVTSDNGMIQFLHDLKKDDGIIKYYIITDESQRLLVPKKYQIEFASRKHRKLLLEAEKIITAFIEENNIFPYGPVEIEKCSNQYKFEIIYLQHGVLHIDMPWKYSPEKVLADKVVVSTEQEAKLFKRNGFFEEHIWKCKMSRFSYSDNGSEKAFRKNKKILFAPSWRVYLTDGNVNGYWNLLERKFFTSVYYSGIKAFLDSNELQQLLEKYGYSLEVKLHPIFKDYSKCFVDLKENIKIIDSVKNPADYDLLVTDFSSYMYDFLYLQIPVLSYIPDIQEFKSGMNGYRNLNYEKTFWENVATTPEILIKQIENILLGVDVTYIDAEFFDVQDSCALIYEKMI